MVCLIVLQSVTYAQRAANVLNKYGIYNSIMRAPAEMGGGSCGYACRIRIDSPQKAIDILKLNAVPYKKVYVANQSGRYTEYY